MTDSILFGGTILTMDEQGTRCAALAIGRGRVLAVGADDVLSLRRDSTTLIDLKGRTVCPGFVDAHHHITLAAWYERGVNLRGCGSKTEALIRIAARGSRASGPGESEGWIYAFNYRPSHFTDGSRLSRHDLDRVAGERPVLVMHFSFHEGVVSTGALRICGISRHSTDPFGGRIVRDRHGEPTGELLETAIGPVEAMARSSAAGTGYEDWLHALERYCRGLFAAGITHVCDPGIDGMLEGYVRRAQTEGRLPIPISMLFVSRRGLFQPPVDRLSGPTTGQEVDGVHVGALKLFADGGSRCAVCVHLRETISGVVALAGRAARLRRPALLTHATAPDAPRLDRSGRLHMGYLHYEPERLASLCRQAEDRGFQIAVHAACNAGIDAVIAAYQGLPAGPFRHRIEHLVSLDRQQARSLAATGAVGVVQPAYVSAIGDEWEAMATPPRLKSVPLRTLLDAGVTLAGSSDAPIADYDPLRGMKVAITRRTNGGLPHQSDERITPLEALQLWTTGAATAATMTGEIGVLCPGARADMVVLSANPLTTPADAFGNIRVERTFLAGQTVFSAAGSPTPHQESPYGEENREP